MPFSRSELSRIFFGSVRLLNGTAREFYLTEVLPRTKFDFFHPNEYLLESALPPKEWLHEQQDFRTKSVAAILASISRLSLDPAQPGKDVRWTVVAKLPAAQRQ